MSTGIGAWWDDLTVQRDGTFVGGFNDTDLDTVYTCSYSGKFKDIKRVNDYTYSMTVAELETERPDGMEWYSEEGMLHIAVEANLKEGETCYIYTPEAPTDQLPTDFLTWFSLLHGREAGAVLGCYGLCNEDASCGYIGQTAEPPVTPAPEPLSQGSLPNDLPAFFSCWLDPDKGGWGTSLTLYADGTFEGDYMALDADAADEESPNGVMYFCSFSGKFRDIKQINTYTYSMVLDNLDIEESEIDGPSENGYYYISTEPYGLDRGETYYFYTREAPLSELPTELTSLKASIFGQQNDTLNLFGICHESRDYIFLENDVA